MFLVAFQSGISISDDAFCGCHFFKREVMMKGFIRKLNINEYERCQEIRPMGNPPQSEDFFDDFKAGNRLIYVYEINGKFVGEAALVYENDDPDYTIPKIRIYMSRVIVNENYRNQGIGAKLIEHLLKVAKEKGFKEVSIGVDEDNYVARHLYEKKMGFTTVLFKGEDEGGKYLKLMRKID